MTRTLSALTAALFAASLFLLAPTALAAECKGQSKSACGRMSACTWVDGYTRKDGAKVKAYCRKAKASKSSSKSGSKKKATSSAKKASSSAKKSSSKKTSSSSKSSSSKSSKTN